MAIKAVLFDCFGVLYIPIGEDFYHSHIPNYPTHRDELRDLDKQADYGLITQDQLAAQVAQLSGLPVEQVRQGIVGRLVRNQALLDVILTLKASHKASLVTNISAGSLDKYFTQNDRQKYFDDVVISSSVGMIKPNPGIYELAARNLGIATDECLFIDDSQQNCDGATNVGMQALLYESTQQVTAALRSLLK